MLSHNHGRMISNTYVFSEYSIKDQRIRTHTKLVFLTDMHECMDDIDGLVRDIDCIKPDAVLIGGDMIIARDIRFEHYHWCDQILEFAQKIAKLYPTYAIDGNHEVKVMSTVLWDGNTTKRCYDYLWSNLIKNGVRNLNDKKISVNGVDIYGLQLGIRYYRKENEKRKKTLTSKDILERFGERDKNIYSVLLAHTPQFFKAYSAWGADLTLAGHYHGGIIKIGRQGLLGPDMEIFPKYCGGLYKRTGSDGLMHQMIVSNGIGEHTTHLRINNPREIVVISLHPADC